MSESTHASAARQVHRRPRHPVPPLSVPTVGGGRWALAEQDPEHFTLVVVYRGLHCPICSRYLADLARRLDDFAEAGVEVVALSTDARERAERTAADWDVDGLTLGYGLSLADARAWGLYLSSGRGATSIGLEEPDLFAEPGMFLVRSDGTLYFGSVQTMPFARPSFREVLGAVQWVLENAYPARGEVTDDLSDAAAAGVGAGS